MSRETITPKDVGSADILGLGKKKPKAKKGPRTCSFCGVKMTPDENEEFLVCPNQEEHPEREDGTKGVAKVKLPDSEYP